MGKIFPYRRWLRLSHTCSQIFAMFVLWLLCLVTFLTLSAFRSSFPSPLLAFSPFRPAPPPTLRKVADINKAAAGRETSNASDPEAMSTVSNRTVLPADCFHALLRSVDPTCDLGLFCTEAWRQEDVLCRVFLHQAALTPGSTQCSLPVPRNKTTKVIKVKDPDTRQAGDSDLVPRLAYYVLVSESCQKPFAFIFLHYLSVLSVQRFLKPYAIYVLGNCVPVGYWWSRVVSDVTTIRFVHRPRPWITKDGKINWIAHFADVIRLQVLLVNGGVYVDTDMILLRPLDPLLQYPLTMGLVDNNTGMGNALILATRGSRFLRDWYAGYRDFRPHHFHYNGMWGALRLWRKDPDSLHLESQRFYSPNWYEAQLLFTSSGYDLSESYAVHVWHRHASVPTDPQQFLTLNSTLGDVFRRIYFGH